MGESLMWSAIVAVALLAWAPVARDLREEFKALRSESARRVQRAARRDVDTIRFCVGGNRPEVVSRTGASAGRHRAPRVANGRAMPPAGTYWRVTVPAGGPATRHGRPVCG